MTVEDIERRVSSLMVELFGQGEGWTVDNGTLDRERLLGADLGIDSLDVVELVMAIEEEFKVEIPDDAIDGRVEDHDVGDVFDVAVKHVLPRSA